MTWLIVEDDPEIRNLVAVMMQVWGEKPMALPDGNAAWQWLDSIVDGSFKGDLPELALMDIRMPGHTGDQIAARMRLTERIKHIPIILMTAFELTEAEVQSMTDRSGIDRLIKKPLPNMDDFRATLYRVRDEKHKRNATAAAEAKTASTPEVKTEPKAEVKAESKTESKDTPKVASSPTPAPTPAASTPAVVTPAASVPTAVPAPPPPATSKS